MYSIDGPFFFGAAETFERTLKSIGAEVQVVIIRLGRVPFIDATGINALREMAKLFQRRGIRMLVCEANEVVQAKLALARLSDVLGPDNIQPDLPAAIRSAW